jgi:opacity protein-like surface antigen
MLGLVALVRRRLVALVLIAATASSASAAIIGAQSLEFGGGYGRLEDPHGNSDLYSYFGRYNQPLGKLLVFETDLRAEYGESREDGGPRDVTWRDSDLDLVFSIKIPILKPYAVVGASYDDFNSNPPLFHSSDWKWGYKLGLGVEFTFIPLLKITPAARYTKAEDDTESLKYSLDVAVWFKRFAVGVTGTYIDIRNSETNVQQGVIYGALRF